MGQGFIRPSIYGIWGSEGNQKETTWLQHKATQRQLEGPGDWRDWIFIFSKEATWSAIKENKLQVGNDANKK